MMNLKHFISPVFSFTEGFVRPTWLLFLVALLPLAGRSQATVSLAPQGAVHSLSVTSGSGAASGGSGAASGGNQVSSTISGRVSSVAGGITSAVSPMRSPVVGAGSSSSGGGKGTGGGGFGGEWQPGKSVAAMGPTGFSGSTFTVGWKGPGMSEGMSSHSALRMGALETAMPGVVSDSRDNTANGGTIVVRTVHGGTMMSMAGFSDSTRQEVSASPGDFGNIPLFSFTPSLNTGIADFENGVYLHPSLAGGGSAKDTGTKLQLNEKIFAVWKEYELGIRPEGQRGGRLNTPGLTFTSPTQKLERERQFRSTLGLYGASVAQRLSDEGIIR
jgi:hypothetical protein